MMKTEMTPPIQVRTNWLATWPAAAFLALATLSSNMPARAATIWTGPPTTFSKADGADPTQAANQDRLTPNVWITRGNFQGLYNAKSEAGYGSSSPAGTEWA